MFVPCATAAEELGGGTLSVHSTWDRSDQQHVHRVSVVSKSNTAENKRWGGEPGVWFWGVCVTPESSEEFSTHQAEKVCHHCPRLTPGLTPRLTPRLTPDSTRDRSGRLLELGHACGPKSL